MQDLKDVTRDIHYENFRAQHIEHLNNQTTRERRWRHIVMILIQSRSVTVESCVRFYSKLKRDSSHNFDNVNKADALLQEKDAEVRLQK